MKMNKVHKHISFLTTISWFITKGLKSRRLHISMIVFITAVAVTELSILAWLTNGIVRFMVVSITFILSILAISEVIVNAILRRAYRVGIFMAFGAKRWLIALSLFIESAIGNLLGSLIGSLMGLIITFILRPSADFIMHPSSIILPFSLGFIIGLIACIYPILKIMEPSISERY